LIGRGTSASSDRVATVSFMAGNRDSKVVVESVDAHRIGIRYGNFYAYRLVEDLGLMAQNGVVRVSMAHYNTIDEVDRLIAALEPNL
jgi:selenocysteine lyase/cysteine desulfurase